MLLGLSQRVENCPKTGETRDCLDQNWSRLFEAFGHITIPIPNNPNQAQNFIAETGIQGIVLTGGNDLCSVDGAVNTSKDRDQTENIILTYGLENNFPILGVCRGLQIINKFFGGTMRSFEGHVATSHVISLQTEKFGPIASINVNSFHNYAIGEEDLASSLVPFALCSDGTVEGAYHGSRNCTGIMWHPERTKSGIDERIIQSIFG